MISIALTPQFMSGSWIINRKEYERLAPREPIDTIERVSITSRADLPTEFEPRATGVTFVWEGFVNLRACERRFDPSESTHCKFPRT